MTTKDVYAGSPTGPPLVIGVGTRTERAERRRKRRRKYVVDGRSIFRTVKKTLEALEGIQAGIDTQNGQKTLSIQSGALPELPEENADGTDIQNLDQLAAAMDIHRKSAPFYVLQTKGAPAHLVREAKQEIKAQTVNGEVPKGAAVLLMLSQDVATELAVPNGETPSMMHCTLGYLADDASEYSDDVLASLLDALMPIANDAPVTADILGYTTFNEDSEERDPCAVILIQSEALAKMHDQVSDALGGLASTTFPTWIPHVAIVYNQTAEVIPRDFVQLRFDRLYLGWGADQYDCATGETVEQRAKAGTKSVRRVRTQEGARIFGQPIGSIIVPNKPHLPDATSPEPLPPEVLTHTSGLKMTVGQDTAQIKKGSKVIAKFKILTNGTYDRWKTYEDQQHIKDNLDKREFGANANGLPNYQNPGHALRFYGNAHHTLDWQPQQKNVTYERDSLGHVIAYAKDSEGSRHKFTVTYDDNGNASLWSAGPMDGYGISEARGVVTLADPKQLAITKAINADLDENIESKLAENPREAVPGTFMDVHEGVYGKQWVREGEPDQELPMEERTKYVRQVLDDYGVNFIGDMSMDTMEAVASTIETYDKMFPGFSRVIPLWEGTDNSTINSRSHNHGNVIADNYSMMYAKNDAEIAQIYRPDSDYEVDMTEIEHGASWIRLNMDQFGREADDGTLGRMVSRNSESGHFSVKMRRLFEQHEAYTEHEIAALSIINHEIGHTVVSIGAGTFYDPSIKDVQKNNEMKEKLQAEFFGGLAEIIDRWEAGKLFGYDESTGHTTFPETALREGDKSLNKKKIGNILSEYGATNLHEMCAEAWAEYCMDKEPRLFAREVGMHMESFIEGYMESLDLEGY